MGALNSVFSMTTGIQRELSCIYPFQLRTKVVGVCGRALSRLADLVAADGRTRDEWRTQEHEQLIRRGLPLSILQRPRRQRSTQVLEQACICSGWAPLNV